MYWQFLGPSSSAVSHMNGKRKYGVRMVITYSEGKDQPSKVAHPACGQLNRENEYFPVRVCA